MQVCKGERHAEKQTNLGTCVVNLLLHSPLPGLFHPVSFDVSAISAPEKRLSSASAAAATALAAAAPGRGGVGWVVAVGSIVVCEIVAAVAYPP